MKLNLILSILLIPLFVKVSYSQTYNYSKLIEKVSIETSSGSTEQRVLNRWSGNFRIIFETPNDPDMKNLFTVLHPGQSNSPGMPWYGHLKDDGYVEKDGKILQKAFYFDTESNTRALVFIATDYSLVVIFKSEGKILEYWK